MKTDEELQAISKEATHAVGVIAEISVKGDKAWKMCVPVMDSDTDQLLTRVAFSAHNLAMECLQMKARIAELEKQVLTEA